MIEDAGDSITNRSHHLLHGTPGFIGVGTVVAFLVSGLTDAADWSERPIQRPNDLSECDLPRVLNKCVSPFDPASAGDKPRSFEREQDLLQKFDRDMLTRHDVLSLKRACSMSQREF